MHGVTLKPSLERQVTIKQTATPGHSRRNTLPLSLHSIQRLHCQDKNAISAKKEKKPSIRRMWLGQLFEQPQMLWTVLPEQPKLLFEQCCMLKTSLAIQSQTTSLHVFYSLCNKVVTSRILSLSSSYVHNIGFQFIPGKSFISYRFRINHWAKYLLIWFH